MNRSIINNNHCFFYFKIELAKKIHKPACIDVFLCCKAFILISSDYYAKNIES